MRTSWVVCSVFNAALLKLILFLQEPVFFSSFTLTLYSLFLNPEKVSSRNSVLLADTKKATKHVFYCIRFSDIT